MSKELANYDEMLAQMAKAASAAEKPSGASISARAGVLQYNGAPVPGNKLDVIIVSSKYTNLYYEDKWDPNNISSPVCFAYGDNDAEMAPHPASPKPQATSCHGCAQNQWGSDPNGGKGKACKNSRALGLVPAGVTPADAPTAEIAVLKLPVCVVESRKLRPELQWVMFRKLELAPWAQRPWKRIRCWPESPSANARLLPLLLWLN